MNYSNLLVENNEGIFTIKINNPSSLNSLNASVLDDIKKVFFDISSDDSVDVVILTGEGKAFVAGADIPYMRDLNALEAKKFSEMGADLFRSIEKFPKVVIAAINGFCLGGGCELAMCCDIRIASIKAKFGQPEVGLGITPGFSATQRLPKIVGVAKAKELIYTGVVINAQEAFNIGLVNKVVEPNDLMDESHTMAKKIQSNSKMAVRFSKEAINNGLDTDMDTAIRYESNLFGLCFSSNDQKEGMTAFLDKRHANFSEK